MRDAAPAAAPDLPPLTGGVLRVSRGHQRALGALTSPLHRGRRLLRRYTANPRALAAGAALVRDLLPELPAIPGLPPPGNWTIVRAQWTITDVAVYAAGTADGLAGGAVHAYVKLPATAEGALNLRRQQVVLEALHADPRLDGWSEVVPRALAAGSLKGRAYLVERAVPGVDLQSLLNDPDTYNAGFGRAAAELFELQRRTAVSRRVDDLLLARWIDAPLALLQPLLAAVMRTEAAQAALARMGGTLRSALAGAEVTVSWVHGDYWPSNILVTPGVRDVPVTGIVDWERGDPAELPLHDTLHLVLHTARMQNRYADLGAAVCALLQGDDLETAEWQLLRDHCGAVALPFAPTPEGLRAMLALYWLRYVATYLAKVPEQAQNYWWVRKNVGAVIGCY